MNGIKAFDLKDADEAILKKIFFAWIYITFTY